VRLAAKLPAHPSVAIIGSTSFWHAESAETCATLGKHLASIPDLVLITGGVPGVGEGVARAFFAERRGLNQDPNVIHVLPRGYSSWEYGVTLFAGDTMEDRRQILARLSGFYLAIEGGPGTAHEGTIAQGRGAVVVPIGRSGAFSGRLYSRLARPPFASEECWAQIGAAETSPSHAGLAAYRIVCSYLASNGHRTPALT
jgi:hypothetical protein